jgi:hypothetical protein
MLLDASLALATWLHQILLGLFGGWHGAPLTRNLEALSQLAYQPRRPTWQRNKQQILAKPPA